MKKCAAVLLGFLLCCACCVGCGKSDDDTWEDDGVFKLLMIGNSYTDDTIEYIWQIANSMGIQAEIGRLTIGGLNLSQHYHYAIHNRPMYDYRLNMDGEWRSFPDSTSGDAILSNDWDFISLQQSSTKSALPETYGDLDPFLGYLNGLTEGKNAKLVWLLTWAYPTKLPGGEPNPNADFAKYFESDQMKMYDALVNTVQTLIVPRGLPIIPSGTAVQNVRSSKIGDNVCRDELHLSAGLGRYISSLTAVRKLTGKQLPGDVYRPGSVTPEEQRIAIEAVENAIKTPFAVTESAYRK